MEPQELLAVLRTRPFRISLTDGRTLDIPQPELVLLNRRSAIIGLLAPGETEPFYDRRITVDLLHMVSLEPIQTPANPNGQG